MRYPILATVLIGLLAVLSCGRTRKTTTRTEANPNFYLMQSVCTDPGELVKCFEDLPEDNEALCKLLKKQLIHPVEVGRFKDVIPEDRYFEDTIYQSVSAMLAGLLKYDSSGLTSDRKPQDRLVVACVHHSLMFASILRERGIPVRIRFGFAPYIGKMAGMDINISHAVCEVWSDEESRWIYVDPDRQMIDFPPDDFVTGAEAWGALRHGDLDANKFRSAFFAKEQSIMDMLRLDVKYALREETMYWGESGAPDVPALATLSRRELRALDDIAELLNHAGANHEELTQLMNEVDFLCR